MYRWPLDPPLNPVGGVFLGGHGLQSQGTSGCDEVLLTCGVGSLVVMTKLHTLVNRGVASIDGAYLCWEGHHEATRWVVMVSFPIDIMGT